MAKRTITVTSEVDISIDLGDISLQALAAGLMQHGRYGLFGDYFLGGDIGDEVEERVVKVTDGKDAVEA